MMPSGLLAALNVSSGDGQPYPIRTGGSSSLSANAMNGNGAKDSTFASVLAESSQSAFGSRGKAKSRQPAASVAEAVSSEKGKLHNHHGSHQEASLASPMPGLESAALSAMPLPIKTGSEVPREPLPQHSRHGEAHGASPGGGGYTRTAERKSQFVERGIGSAIRTDKPNARASSTAKASSQDLNTVGLNAGKLSFLATNQTARATEQPGLRNVETNLAQRVNGRVANEATTSAFGPLESSRTSPLFPSREGVKVLGVTYQSAATQVAVPPDAVKATMVDRGVAGKELTKGKLNGSLASGMSNESTSVASFPPVAGNIAARAQTSAASKIDKSLQEAPSRRVGANGTQTTASNESMWSLSGNSGMGATHVGNSGFENMGIVTLSRPDTSAQLAGMAANLASSGRGRLQVKVQPEGMGTLVITAAKHADGISVQLVASSSVTASLLSSATAQIREDMQRLGLQISGVMVSQGQGFSLGNQQQNGAKRDRRGLAGERVLQSAAVSARTTPSSDGVNEVIQAPSRSRISVQA